MKMTVRLKGVKAYKDRLGQQRLYHRKSGTPIDASLSAAEIIKEVDRLNALHAPKKAVEGSLGALFTSFRAAPAFTSLAGRTQLDYNRCMDYLKPLEMTPLKDINTAFIAMLRDKTLKKKKAGFTNHMLAMLSSAFKHGREYGIVDANPVSGIEKAKMAADRKRENRPWSKDERDNVLSIAPRQLRLPLALARYLGMRRGDILKLPRSAYREGMLSFRQSKTGKLMKLPVIGRLRDLVEDAISEAPKGDAVTLCLNSDGMPWTEMGFTASQRKFFLKCIEREIAGEGITLHGLRHSVATDLRSLGYSIEQIKDYLGHDTVKITEHYSSSADVNSLLIDMANVLEGGTKRKRVLSNRDKKSV